MERNLKPKLKRIFELNPYPDLPWPKGNLLTERHLEREKAKKNEGKERKQFTFCARGRRKGEKAFAGVVKAINWRFLRNTLPSLGLGARPPSPGNKHCTVFAPLGLPLGLSFSFLPSLFYSLIRHSAGNQPYIRGEEGKIVIWSHEKPR